MRPDLDHRAFRAGRQSMKPPIEAPTDSEQRAPADHWRRFRRLMLLMTVVAFATAGFAIWQMRADGVPFHLHFVIAMGGGIIIALLLAGGLMGLAFVSNRSGHDDAVTAIDEPDA
jgi:hypothetical protein